MPINATWHRAHPMPQHPTAAQRLAWHVEHAQECGCRTLTADMRKRLTLAAKTEQQRPAARKPRARAKVAAAPAKARRRS